MTGEGTRGDGPPERGEQAGGREPARLQLPREPDLTEAQQQLFLDHAVWLESTTKRLVRRFKKWVRAEDVAGLVRVVTMGCAARFDPAHGAPFEGYATMAIMYELMKVAGPVRALARRAYLVAATWVELLIADPRIQGRPEEERQDALHGLAGQAVTGIVVASAFSTTTAGGGEDAMIDALDGQRVLTAVQGLAPRKREVMERRYGVDEPPQTLPAIAGVLGVGTITVRRDHAEALAELRTQLA